MYGWRARIGMLYPSGGISEEEFYRLAPEGVSIHTTRLPFKRGSLEEDKRLANFVRTGGELVADARVDLIAFNCTAGSLAEGKGHDQKIIDTIEAGTGIKATTTATAAVNALQSFNKKRIILITPYLEEVNQVEIQFLRDHGFEVVASKGLGISDPIEQASVNPQKWYALAREYRESEGEVYFISCAGIRVVEMISAIERDMGKPVVTSNQALMWHCLKLLNLKAEHNQHGALFQS